MWSACAFPLHQEGSLAVGCITVEREGSGRHEHYRRWIGERRATAKEVDAELRHWPPAAAEASRGLGEAIGALAIFAVGGAAFATGALTTFGTFTHGREEPYGLFLMGGGLASEIAGLVIITHANIHEPRAWELYNDAATARDQCPVRAPQ
jgi:hypothetical protein